MTADEAIQYIHEKIWQGSKPGLSRTRELLSRMGSPQDRLKFIHIAGTNGKGSTSAMLSSILKSAGYKTGLYTSPFISNFNERIRINDIPITDIGLADITEFCAPLVLSMADRPTEFELVTSIAMEYFARQDCDIVVLETGMGGRLDSTNVIEKPLCTVITNIGLDHTRELGDTVEKITVEKAGIIKENCPTVIYDLPDNIREVILSKCEDMSSSITSADFNAITPISDSREGQIFSYKNFSSLELPLLGSHQLKNAAVVLETIGILHALGFQIDEAAVKTGLKNTQWPGRFEIVSEKPYFVVDGGHNPQCAETVAENLQKYFPNMERIILLGVLSDKDYMGLAGNLNPAASAYVTITPNSPRALSAYELADRLACFKKPVFPCESIQQGIEKAIELAGIDGVICSVGSLYTAGTVREFFGK